MRTTLLALALASIAACSGRDIPPIPPPAGDGGAQDAGGSDGGVADGGGTDGGTDGGAPDTGTPDAGPACGDGVVDYALLEECDDGNAVAGDGCFGCRREKPPTCGDGALDLAHGEECDDGATAPGDGCSPTCQFEPVGATCGDSQPQAGEACDDGNRANGDGCNPTCNFRNETSLFAGGVGISGRVDATGAAARFGGGAVVLVVDATSLWIGDSANRVLRVADVASAAVSTAAGDGTQGVRDDPVGTSARFGDLSAVATDGVTVWVADSRRIRAVAALAPHAVTTVAGSGNQAVTDGFGASAEFDDPRGLTWYAGKVYSVDAVGAVLRSFDPSTGEVRTLAGTAYQYGHTDGVGAAARFVSPRYMASDNSGMLYVADTNGNEIRSYNTVTGQVGTLAGSGVVGYLDGVGTAALIHRPRGMTSDGTSLYFVEFNQQTVRQVELATAEVSTMVGQHCGGAATCAGGYVEGTGTAARFDSPFSIAFHFPSRSLFVYDGGNVVIRRVR